MVQVDDQRKGEILEIFKQVYDISESAKAFSGNASDLKKNLAKALGVKTKVVNSAYTLWVRSIEEPEVTNDVDSILNSIC